MPLTTDFDWRDSRGAPVIDLNSAVDAERRARDNTVNYTAAARPRGRLPAADVSDFGENDIARMNITVGGRADGATEIVRIGGDDFALNADSTQTVTIAGTRLLGGLHGGGRLRHHQRRGGAMPQAAAGRAGAGRGYRNSSPHATAGDRTLTSP